MTRRTKKPVGWRGDPHEHNMARLGIETRDPRYVFRADGIEGVTLHFREMREDELADAEHYKQMAEDYPEYEWVFEKMAGDERRHAALVKRMEQGEDIDIRKVIKDDVGDVLDALEKAGRIAPMNKEKLQKGADKFIDNMDVQKLKASGLEMALVTSILSSMGGKLADRMFDAPPAPAAKR